MSGKQKRKLSRLAWALPLVTVAGFALAIPESNPALEIDALSLTHEESAPFDRSVRQGMEAMDLLTTRGNIDMVTPNTVVNNTNIDIVTPNTVVNNTNIDIVTPNTVVNNTNIDIVTPNTVVNNTNIATTTPGVVISASNDMSAPGYAVAGGAVTFFPRSAELPQPNVAAND